MHKVNFRFAIDRLMFSAQGKRLHMWPKGTKNQKNKETSKSLEFFPFDEFLKLQANKLLSSYYLV